MKKEFSYNTVPDSFFIPISYKTIFFFQSVQSLLEFIRSVILEMFKFSGGKKTYSYTDLKYGEKTGNDCNSFEWMFPLYQPILLKHPFSVLSSAFKKQQPGK